ncbi:SIR2 family protein [Pasteurella oralis]|uniref:SIR2 family protein n=1 Tax=Pasteurella oralis TaxID=1071947 RepID=UPI000C7E0A92|nr:SIR2 family protein [Pasteurella oralis]
MSANHIFTEIAYALSHNRLCLFTGAGFTKAITDGKAPSWRDLLQQVCQRNELPLDILDEANEYSAALNLEEKAQLIAGLLQDKKKSIHVEISEIIQDIQLAITDIENIKTFFKNESFHLLTTNYDKLAEQLAGENYQSFSPKKPIPRSSAKTKIYHIHGAIDAPDGMVVTAEDYFQFINYESYFSRKLSVCLHENLVVILGYSLSDTNLKAIINEYKGFSTDQHIASNIFFVSRDNVSQYTKDYYSNCFGIRVIDNMEIDDFFKAVNEKSKLVKQKKDKKIENIKNVLYNGREYTDSYLKKDIALFEILASIQALGIDLKDEDVLNLINCILKKKIEFTRQNSAWEQYYHLALWLAYLASIIKLYHSPLKAIFLEGVQLSLSMLGGRREWATPWEATLEWQKSWGNIIPENRLLIKEYVEENIYNDYARKLVGLL